MKKHGVDLNVDLEALQVEYEQLQTSHGEYTGQLAAVQEELKPLKEIRYWVSKVLAPEQAEVKKKPEPKHSVTEQIQDYREESRKRTSSTGRRKNRIWNCKASDFQKKSGAFCFVRRWNFECI